MEKTITASTIEPALAEQLAELFKAYSDPSRLRIIATLLDDERIVGEIAAIVGISESAVSHHLRGLRQLNLVRGRREGRLVHYSLADEHVSQLYRMGLDHLTHSHD
jgi:ArsR family transcriptional regulator